MQYSNTESEINEMPKAGMKLEKLEAS